VLDILQGISVEQVEFTLPENGGQMIEELREDLSSLRLSSSISDPKHKLVDISTDLVGISPFSHL